MYANRSVVLPRKALTVARYNAANTNLRSHTSLLQASRQTIPSFTSIRSLSVWQSIVPKFLRNWSNSNRQTGTALRGRAWNPATFFIIIFLIIGSNAIQMISLRNNLKGFSRQAEARIRLLKTTITQVQQGKEIDVQEILGSGQTGSEDEWNEVMKALKSSNETIHSDFSDIPEVLRTENQVDQIIKPSSSSNKERDASICHRRIADAKVADQDRRRVQNRFF